MVTHSLTHHNVNNELLPVSPTRKPSMDSQDDIITRPWPENMRHKAINVAVK
jgi:hypothetical protein